MRRYGRLAAVLCLCVLLLGGCGEAKVPDVVDVPTVSVGKGGEITVWQIGEFDKTYYNLSELTAMAEREAAEYNAENGKEAAVAVEKVEALEGGKVAVVYRFDNGESCADFCESSIYFGTVKEAAVSGFELSSENLVMKSVKDGTQLSGGILQEGDKYLVITDMKANIYCPGTVAYISEGAVVNGDGSIDSSGAEGLVYILLK